MNSIILLLSIYFAYSFGLQVVDFEQCDRQCRYYVSFYNRLITGVKVDKYGDLDTYGSYCKCFDNGVEIKLDPVERLTSKPWDTSFWCGDFKTSKVCVLEDNDSKVPSTILRQDIIPTNVVLHCGQCGSCSSKHDIEVMYNTKATITTLMTKCATKFNLPRLIGGSGNDVAVLEECLSDVGIDFSTKPVVKNEPSCMNCWTDNIMCDSVNCKLDLACLKKFIFPFNSGDMNGCLICDETKCGQEFIRCSGANRRALGIQSDIHRDQSQICDIGYYSNKAVLDTI